MATVAPERASPGLGDAWLWALRRYFAVIVPRHLVWEFAQLPVCTICRDGSAGEMVFAILHCTGGDIIIALASFMGAVLLLGRGWLVDPATFRRVALLAIASCFGYTAFSEWLNTEVRGAWTCSAHPASGLRRRCLRRGRTGASADACLVPA